MLLKIQILEANEAAARAGLETAEDEKKERDEFEAGLDEEGYEKFPSTEAPKASGAKSPKSSEGATTRSKTIEADIIKDRTNLMSKVMEGLRGDAFLVARDMGINALVADGGMRELVHRIKQSVFPRASEEARELFCIGQVRSGPLSRQPSESMRSYCDRRRRWWRTLQELDSSTSLSEPMRCELLIELSGLTHQEALVIKACAGSPLSFGKVANTLIEHYGSVHLRGGRPLGHQGPSMGSGKEKTIHAPAFKTTGKKKLQKILWKMKSPLLVCLQELMKKNQRKMNMSMKKLKNGRVLHSTPWLTWKAVKTLMHHR